MPPKKSSVPVGLTSKFQIGKPKSREKPVKSAREQESDKRPKACLRCRKSKVKCVNNGEAPCKRCKQGKYECIFQMKIQSYSSTEVKPVEIETDKPKEWKSSMENRLEKFDNALTGILGFLKDGQFHPQLPSPSMRHVNSFNNVSYPPLYPQPNPYYYYNEPRSVKLPAFNEVLSTEEPQFGNDEVSRFANVVGNDRYQKRVSGTTGEQVNNFGKRVEPQNEESIKKPKNDAPISEKSLRDVISYSAFQSFYTKFTATVNPYLFGFDISRFDDKLIYLRGDLMVALVALIATENDPKYKTLFSGTASKVMSQANPGFFSSDEDSQEYFKDEYNKYIDFCEKEDPILREWRKWSLLTKDEKATEISQSAQFKLFMNIAALCIATFWFQDSNLLLGVALQLAGQLDIEQAFAHLQNSKITSIDSDSEMISRTHITSVDKLKLWYLIYIADYQQSLVTKKMPIMNSSDISVANARKLLLQDKTDSDNHRIIDSNDLKATNILVQTVDDSSLRTLNEKLIHNTSIYKDLRLVSQLEFNQAISLALSGNAWGILSPDTFGMPWKTNLDLDKWMVRWTCVLTPIHQLGNAWPIKSMLLYYNFARVHINQCETNELPANEEKSKKALVVDSDLMTDDEEVNNQDLAIFSAQSMIKSIISDRDIKGSLGSSPLHIYVMSYYAALVLLDSNSIFEASLDMNEFKMKSTEYFENVLLVRTLLKVFKENMPIDKEFGYKLISSLTKKLEKKYGIFKKVGQKYSAMFDRSEESIDKIQQVDNMNDYEVKKLLGENETKRQILAWPGTNHGHP